MLESISVLFNDHPYEHLNLLNSEALTAESEVDLVEFSVELRPLIEQVRRTIAESKRLQAQGAALRATRR
jgi:hypothetical protein